jgi:hypothetical protein
MHTLAIKFDDHAVDVHFTENALHVFLADGREVSAPLEWFPRLRDVDSEKRNNWRFIGKGLGIHWPDVDEDISISTLLSKAD